MFSTDKQMGYQCYLNFFDLRDPQQIGICHKRTHMYLLCRRIAPIPPSLLRSTTLYMYCCSTFLQQMWEEPLCWKGSIYWSFQLLKFISDLSEALLKPDTMAVGTLSSHFHIYSAKKIHGIGTEHLTRKPLVSKAKWKMTCFNLPWSIKVVLWSLKKTRSCGLIAVSRSPRMMSGVKLLDERCNRVRVGEKSWSLEVNGVDVLLSPFSRCICSDDGAGC